MDYQSRRRYLYCRCRGCCVPRWSREGSLADLFNLCENFGRSETGQGDARRREIGRVAAIEWSSCQPERTAAARKDEAALDISYEGPSAALCRPRIRSRMTQKLSVAAAIAILSSMELTSVTGQVATGHSGRGPT